MLVIYRVRVRDGQLLRPGGQKSRSYEAENRFGCLTKASFSTAFGRVALCLLVCIFMFYFV